MFKNDNQREAYQMLMAFAEDDAKELKALYTKSKIKKINPSSAFKGSNMKTRFVLAGPAGVGKTHIAGLFLKEIKARYPKKKIVAIAVSHQAVSRLRAALGSEDVQCMTVAKFYSLTPRLNDDGDTVFVSGFNTHRTKADILIVDEASQSNNSVLEDKYLKDSKIIYLGDMCQLPPVSGGKSALETVSGIEMTEPIRFDASIGNSLEEIRRWINAVPFVNKGRFIPQQTWDEDEGKGIVCLTYLLDAIYDKAGNVVDTPYLEGLLNDFRLEPQDTKILCYTNKSVLYHNTHIKAVLNPDKLGIGFDVGDPVITNNNLVVGTGKQSKTVLNNSTNFVIQGIRKIHTEDLKVRLESIFDKLLFDFDTVSSCRVGIAEVTSPLSKKMWYPFLYSGREDYASFRSMMGSIYSSINDIKDDIPSVKKAIGVLAKNGIEYMKELPSLSSGEWMDIGVSLKSIKGDLEEYIKLLDTGILKMELNYAMTTHKAQGSEFKTVYVNSYDMEQARGGYKTYLNLMYTAMTRCKKALKVIISPQPFKVRIDE